MKAGAACACIAALAVLLSPAAAQFAGITTERPVGEFACSIEAWTNNAIGRDVEVRQEPNAGSPVVGRLPITAPNADQRYSVRFSVTASFPGWLKIKSATDQNNGETARPVFSGDGWILADAVRFHIQSARGYEGPASTHPRVLDLGDDWATEMGQIERVLGCDHEWVLIDLVVERKRQANGGLIELPDSDRPRVRAWFRGVCGIEETTCEVKSVDGGP